jgi:uncharacterized protein YijF (DUF1287 family)
MIRQKKPAYSKIGEPEGNVRRTMTLLEAFVLEAEKTSHQMFSTEQKHEKTNQQYSAWPVVSRCERVPKEVI